MYTLPQQALLQSNVIHYHSRPSYSVYITTASLVSVYITTAGIVQVYTVHYRSKPSYSVQYTFPQQA